MIGEDLTPFFVAGEFAGVEDTLDGAPVVGIFDGAYAATGAGIGMSTTRPAYTLPTSAVPAEPEGLVLIADGGKHFTVMDHEPDGTGVTVLILENA